MYTADSEAAKKFSIDPPGTPEEQKTYLYVKMISLRKLKRIRVALEELTAISEEIAAANKCAEILCYLVSGWENYRDRDTNELVPPKLDPSTGKMLPESWDDFTVPQLNAILNAAMRAQRPSEEEAKN